MSDIKINVQANTDPAKQSFSNLSKYIKNVQKDAQNFGIGGSESSNLTDFASKDKDNIGDLSEVIRKLSNNIDKLGQSFSARSAYNNSTNFPSSPYSFNSSDVNSSNNKSFKDNLFGNLTKSGLAIGAGRAVFSYLNNGSKNAAAYEKNALDIYNRLGVYGSDFNKARSEASNQGKKYGFDTGQVMNLQDTLVSGGYYGQNDLKQSSKDMMETSLAFGINANSLGSDFSQLRKRSFDNISSKEYTDAIGTNIAATGMKGREDELARSLADITDVITKGKLEVTSSDFEMAASLQAQLARQNPALKGDKAAELVGKMQGGFNAKDNMTLRMFGYGEELGYGPEALKEARRRAEHGFSDPEAIKALTRNLGKNLHGDLTMESLWLQDNMGVTVDEGDEVVKLLNQGPESYKEIQEKYGKGGNKEAQLNNATNSNALINANYELNKEATSMDAGNALNEATRPFKETYNNMPSFLQGTSSIAGQALIGGGIGAAVANVPRLLIGNLGKGAGSSAGESAKVFSLFSKLKNPVVAEEGGNVAKSVSFLGENAGKFSKGLGIAGTAITVGTYGYEAYNNFKKGDVKEGFGSIGAGAGTLGGGFAGAKYGAMAGTAIAGPVGTIIGGALGGIAGAFVGDKLGRKLGKGAASISTVEASELHKDKKGKDLVSRKELVVKREEQLLDRLENGGLFNITVEGSKGEKKIKSTGTNKKAGSSYAQSRSQYAFNRANGLPVDTGPLEGNENFDKIWSYFKKQGFSDAGTAGIMANLQAESGLNPAQKQLGGGPGRGLAQWEGPRFKNLVNYAQSKGTDWTDLKTQLDFLMQEMNSDYKSSWYDSFKTSNDARKSAASFENTFERPANNHNVERGNIAETILSQGIKQLGDKKDANIGSRSNISSYAIGIDRVPEDQLAFIHKDEAVLSKLDAKDYRESNLSNATNGTINLNVSINGAENNTITEQVKEAILTAIKQLSNSQQKFQLNQVYQRKAR